MGKHKAAFYRIVAADSRRSAKAGPYVEELGYYSPSRNPAVIRVDKDKVKKWLDKGARLTPTVKSVLKKMGAYEARVKTKKKKSASAKASADKKKTAK